MGNVNKVFLLGRIKTLPRLLDFPNEKQVLYFTVVTSETFVKSGISTVQREFHRVKVLDGTVMLTVLKLHVGQLVYIEGKVHTHKYFENGEKKYQIEIITNRVTVLS